MNGRRDGLGGEDSVGEFEEGIAPAVEAFVERAAKSAKRLRRFHGVPIMHLPTASRTPYLPAELKRKLRSSEEESLKHYLVMDALKAENLNPQLS